MERARGSSPAGYTFSPRWPASNSHGPHGQGRRLDVGRPDLDHASDRGVAGPKDQRVGERVAGQVEDVLAGEPVESQLVGPAGGGDLHRGRPVLPTAVQLDDEPRGPALGALDADLVALEPD